MLKKWQRFLAEEHQDDINSSEKLRTEVSVKVLIKVLGASKSGYYDWRNRQASEREILDDELKIKIQQIFTKNKGRYGSPAYLWR